MAVFDGGRDGFSGVPEIADGDPFAVVVSPPVFVHEILPLPDGSVIASAFPYRSQSEQVEGGISRDTTTVVLCTPQGELIDTVGRFPVGEFFTGPDVPRWDVPFARGSSFALSTEGLVFGDNETPGFEVVGFGDGPRRVIRWDRVLRRVTNDDVARWRQGVLNEASDEEMRRFLEGLTE